MVITKTPFRISFFGGGTDYPVWYKKKAGIVIATSIDKYCHVTTRYLPPFFDHKYRIRYTRREEKNNINDIDHPSVRECLRYLNFKDGIEMVHTSDLPAMSGLGSSSAFTVGFLNSLYALTDISTDNKKVALDAIHIEQNLIKENVGSQDQVVTAVGGLNTVKFSKKGIDIEPILIPEKRLRELEGRILLFFTGFPRHASVIAAEQIQNTPNKTKELDTMVELAKRAKDVLLSNRNLDEFGKLLDKSWRLKRTLSSKITTPHIDDIYKKAMAAGALGGKLLGAGGGGFMIFFARPEKHKKIIKALNGQLHVPFRFDTKGSEIIYRSSDTTVTAA